MILQAVPQFNSSALVDCCKFSGQSNGLRVLNVEVPVRRCSFGPDLYLGVGFRDGNAVVQDCQFQRCEVGVLLSGVSRTVVQDTRITETIVATRSGIFMEAGASLAAHRVNIDAADVCVHVHLSHGSRATAELKHCTLSIGNYGVASSIADAHIHRSVPVCHLPVHM